MTAATPVTDLLTTLGPDDARAVRALGAAASAVDRAESLNEDALLRITGADPAPGVRHLLRRDAAGGVVGYAQLVEEAGSAGGELLVHPDHRRAGHGSALLTAVEAQTSLDIALWSHGDTPGAAALAERRGWRRTRELLRMQRRVEGLDGLAVPDLAAGLEVRAFRPGADDEAWTAVNAAAFAQHPEQGRWTVEDLGRRLVEPWFEAERLQLAVDGSGAVLGFCWMKVEDGVGELYVLGVSPAAAGRGLGKALLARGLRGLLDVDDLQRVELYVDGDNEPAVRLYSGLGFTVAGTDVQYRSPVTTPGR